MNYDILDRIKQMKQKLLELKTAHMHGLGNFKVIRNAITVQKQSSWNSSYVGKIYFTAKKSVNSDVFPPLINTAFPWGNVPTITEYSQTSDSFIFTFSFTPANMPSSVEFVIFSTIALDLSYRVELL